MRFWQRIRQARLRVCNHPHLAHTFKSKVSQIIQVAAALCLGAAIVSKDPGSIAKNAKLVLKAAVVLLA